MAEDLLDREDVTTDPPGADGDVPPEDVTSGGPQPGGATVDSTAAEDAEFRRIVLELEGDITRLDVEVQQCSEELKEAKAGHATAVAKLRAYVREYRRPSSLPLFDQQATAPPGPPPHEAWRTVPLRQVLADFPEKQLETLENADIHTMGDFEKFRAARGEYDWGLLGIGPERRSKIEEKVLSWLGEYMANNPAPPKDSPEDADAE